MTKTVALIPLVMGLLLLSACESEYLNAPGNPDQQKLLDLVNGVRAVGCDCGNTSYPPVGMVTWNNTMESAAQIHSDDMDNRDKLTHTGSDGSDVGDRLSELGYNWVTVGENIAVGYASEEKVIEGWLDSPTHCSNIMDAGFNEMGVATSGPYWTQVFGRE